MIKMKFIIFSLTFVPYVLGATLPNDNITPKYFDGIVRNGIAEEIVDSGSTDLSGQQETGTATGVSTADGIPAQLHDVVDFGDSAPLTAVKEKRCPRVGAPILQLAKRDIDKSRLFDVTSNKNHNEIVGMHAPDHIPTLQSRFLDENDSAGYMHLLTSVEAGKHMDLICRLLGIKDKDNIEKLFLLAKTRTRVPSIVSRAKTLGDEEHMLADDLNAALDHAIEEKTKLSPDEIDSVVEKYLNQLDNKDDISQTPVIASRQKEVEPESPIEPLDNSIVSKTDEIEPKPKSLFDSLRERLAARMPTPKPHVQKFIPHSDGLDDQMTSDPVEESLVPESRHEDSDDFASKPILQPKNTLKSVNQVVEPESVGSSKDVEDHLNNINFDNPADAKDILENLKKQVSNAQGNEDLDRAKSVLERIQTMVKDLEEHERNKLNTKRKLDLIEESLNKDNENEAPTILSRTNDNTEKPEPTENKEIEDKFPKLTLNKMNNLPEPTEMKNEDNTLKATNKVTPQKFDSEDPSSNAQKPEELKPRMLDTLSKNLIEQPKKNDILENIRNKLKNRDNTLGKLELPHKSLFENKKASMDSLTKRNDMGTLKEPNTQNDKIPSNKISSDLFDFIKKSREEVLQKQAELLKMQEEQRENLLESIKNKFLSNTPQISDSKSPIEQAKLEDADKINEAPELKSRNTFDDKEDIIGSQANPLKENDSNVYFVGDGVKLPLKMIPGDEGSIHLSVDIDKICLCKNSTCPKKRDIAAVLGTILEKEAELKTELESTSHHGLSTKIARSTDKLIHDLENAGFDIQQEIVVLPNENVTVPILTELKDIQTNEQLESNSTFFHENKAPVYSQFKDNKNDVKKQNHFESIHEYVAPTKTEHNSALPHLTKEEEKILNHYLQTTTESGNEITTFRYMESNSNNEKVPEYKTAAVTKEYTTTYKPSMEQELSNNANEEFDETLKIKPYKSAKMGKEYVSTHYIDNSRTNMATNGKFPTSKLEKMVTPESDLTTNILSFMKNLAGN